MKRVLSLARRRLRVVMALVADVVIAAAFHDASAAKLRTAIRTQPAVALAKANSV